MEKLTMIKLFLHNVDQAFKCFFADPSQAMDVAIRSNALPYGGRPEIDVLIYEIQTSRDLLIVSSNSVLMDFLADYVKSLVDNK